MPEQETKEINMTSKHDFYFETALYDIVMLDALEENSFSGDVDAYSSKNNSPTTYRIDFEWVDIIEQKYTYPELKKGYAQITLTCKRKEDDILRFFIYKDEIEHKFIEKIGQDPSLADLQFAYLGRKYDKVLPEEDLKNLKKAIGLMAHGAGAGSLVYLRRIFENIIWDTFENNKDQLKISDVDFKNKRMDEKVEALKKYLPSQLIEMKSVYGILSKGVHELSEKECLTYFPALKLSIILILDQKIETEIKEKRDANVKKAIANITQQINGK